MISTEAQTKGCQQVLWLYGPDELITEVGATNIFFMWKNNHGGERHVRLAKNCKKHFFINFF